MRIKNRYRVYYSRVKFWLYEMLGLPNMTGKEVNIVKYILSQLKNKEITVFEWGMGSSTIYFTNYLRSIGKNFRWFAIDNNREWFDKISDKVKNYNLQGINLYLREFVVFWEKTGGNFCIRGKNELDYINFPKTLPDKFDVLLIDGRFRRLCLEVAKEVVMDDGIIILHDAHRPHYQRGLSEFPCQTIISGSDFAPFQKLHNEMWLGSNYNNKIINNLKGRK